MDYQHERIFNWKFLAMLCIFMLTTALVIFLFVVVNQSQQKSERIGKLIEAQRVQQVINAENTAKAYDNQLLELAYTRALVVRQDAILSYLSKHGEKIPQRLLNPVVPPVLNPIINPYVHRGKPTKKAVPPKGRSKSASKVHRQP